MLARCWPEGPQSTRPDRFQAVGPSARAGGAAVPDGVGVAAPASLSRIRGELCSRLTCVQTLGPDQGKVKSFPSNTCPRNFPRAGKDFRSWIRKRQGVPDNRDWLIEQRRAVGARTRELRERQGLSQIQLGERAGMSHKTISRLENGVQAFTVDQIHLLARALGVPPWWLFFYDE